MNGNAVQAAENPAERGVDRMEETQATPATSSGSGGSNGKTNTPARNIGKVVKTAATATGAGVLSSLLFFPGPTMQAAKTAVQYGVAAAKTNAAIIGRAAEAGAWAAAKQAGIATNIAPYNVGWNYLLTKLGSMGAEKLATLGSYAIKGAGGALGKVGIGGGAHYAAIYAGLHPALALGVGGLAAAGAAYGAYKGIPYIFKKTKSLVRRVANGAVDKYRQWRHNSHMNYVRRMMLEDPTIYEELGVMSPGEAEKLRNTVGQYQQKMAEYEKKIEEMEKRMGEQAKLIEQLSQGIKESVDGSEQGDNKDSINSEKETPGQDAKYVRNGMDGGTHEGGSKASNGGAERLAGTYAVDMFPDGAVVYRLGEYTNGERTVRLWERIGGNEAAMVVRALQEGNRDGLTIYVNNRLSGMQAVFVGGMPYASLPAQQYVPVAYVPAGGCSGCNIFANQAIVYPRGVVGIGNMASKVPVTGMQYASPMASPLVNMQQQFMI